MELKVKKDVKINMTFDKCDFITLYNLLNKINLDELTQEEQNLIHLFLGEVDHTGLSKEIFE